MMQIILQPLNLTFDGDATEKIAKRLKFLMCAWEKKIYFGLTSHVAFKNESNWLSLVRKSSSVFFVWPS